MRQRYEKNGTLFAAIPNINSLNFLDNEKSSSFLHGVYVCSH